MMPVTFAASEVLKAIDGCDCYQISMFDLIHTNKVQLKRSPVWSETIDRPMHNEGDNTYVGYSCPVTMHRFAITVFIFEDDFSFTTWKNGKRIQFAVVWMVKCGDGFWMEAEMALLGWGTVPQRYTYGCDQGSYQWALLSQYLLPPEAFLATNGAWFT